MEMALRPQRPLCPRSRVALVVRPAGSGGGGGRRAQPFLMTGRFTGSRIVRCMVASSDSPSRKSRRTVSPHIKVTSRGYAPRLTIESSTKKREPGNSDEETLGTCNRLLSTDASEWTGSREAETAEVDSLQNASSSSIMRDVDADDEDIFGLDITRNAVNRVTVGKLDAVDEAGVEEDIFEVDLSGTALSSFGIGEVLGIDEAGGAEEDDKFEVDLSGNVSNSTAMRDVYVVNEAEAVQDTFEADLSGNVSNSATIGETDSVDEAGVVLDMFDASLLGNVSSSATMWKMDLINEAEVVQDMFDANLLGNVSSSATMEKVDLIDEAEVVQDMFDANLLGNVSSSETMGKVDLIDEAEVVQDMLDADLPENVSSSAKMGKVDSVDEAEAVQDKFDVDLLGNVTSSATMGEVDSVDEAEAVQGTFDADLSGNVMRTVGEVDAVDEAGDYEHLFDVHLQGNILSSVTYGEVDVVDESMAVQDKFEADLSGNVSSSATSSEVDETRAEKVTFEMDLSGDVSSSVRPWEVDEVDEARAGKRTFVMDLLGRVFGNTKHMVGDSVDGPTAKEDIYQQQYPALSSTSMEGKTIEKTHVSSKPQLMPLVRVQEQGKSISSDHEQEGSIVTFHEQNQQMVVFHEQEQMMMASDKQNHSIARVPIQDQSIAAFIEQNQSIVASDKQDRSIVSAPRQNQSIIGFHEQDKAIVDVPEHIQSIVGPSKQEQSIVASDKQDRSIVSARRQNQSIIRFHEQGKAIVDVPEHIQSIVGPSKQEQSIVASDKQDRSIVSAPRQNQSIIGFHEQGKAIVDVPEHIQSITGPSKQEQSIVAFRKQDRSIVSAPRQKQSIVGFNKQDLSIVSIHKQNLSIVGTSGKGQTKQVAPAGRHDVLHVKGVEAKDGDITSQKIDWTEEALEMTTSKRFDGELLFMTEDHISFVEEQRLVAVDGLSLAEDGTGIDDKLKHVLSEEELSCAEDEVGLSEDAKQYRISETAMSVEPDIQESPQDDVDPEALRRMLQEHADKNYSMGNKLFVFPEVVKPDSVIDIYLNRDLTALASEPDVLIKGAFNGWRWKPFTERLHKSELGGVWWSCKLYIPKEAYRLDFVFFNGRQVYENNSNNDFVIEIQSTMDQDLFEDFLAKEKEMELERLAIEEAKRMKQTEEQRRKEEERVADEAIRAQVKAEVEVKKNKLHNMLSLARTCADNLWYIEASTDGRGDTVRLYYNRNSRPLVHSTDIWMHGGYNNWNDGLSFFERLVKCDDKDGDWWYVDVIIPEKALVLDWVFADGPPGKAGNYDNNGRQDFHAILPNIMTEEAYWEEEELGIYTRLLQERREREEAIKRKAERSAKMKAEMKAKTMRRFLLSQKHIVYTEPLEIHAGTTVDVLYNPSNTVLNGKPEVWFRCSFNLWMHPGGALPPQKMVKARDGSLLKATVSVPPDAYMMDFVFSESEEGGVYDNRNGMDYHIPVLDSVATEARMHIVHIAVEMAPIAKVGGLGDVVTSLSRAVQDLGHTVEVILPKYDCLNQKSVKDLHLYRSFSWGGTEVKVWVGLVEDLTVYFLEPQNGMFGVGCVYGRNDDRRFGFFCHSALEFILQNGSSPHIIHCHDWSSAPVAWLYKENYAQSRLGSARVVFTIHNLEFGAHYIGKAMTFCDKATTVSHTYSREVAGHGAIAPHRGKFYGILNGIDPDIWDPYTDDFIPVPYTPDNVVEGKHAAKRALQQKLGLQQTDVPIVGIITRLTAQKGIHLIKHAIHRTLESNGQVVLLGSAPDPRIQDDFCRLADELHGVYHGRVRLVLTYDEPLSHLIYAGSDFILVPSIFEPCGLTQLVAMRYGSIPIVRRTGGLYDTVFDVDHDKDRARSLGLEPNGFSFDGADSNGVDYALNRAIAAWFDSREWFHSLCKRVMEQDWSWNRPALDYIELYHSARKF